MTIYRGLNVAKSLSDISNSDVALANLGLRIDNLDLIRNLSAVITRDEIHTLSGLVDDQRNLMASMQNAASVAGLDSARIKRADTDQVFNYEIDNKLVCGTIKFNYIDFSDASWGSKGADISTSRVSSWSPFGPPEAPDQFIIYNSDVHVKGKYLSITDLSLTKAPDRKRFRSEVATHIIKININGKLVSFPVMRGIPFEMVMSKPDPRITFYFKTPLLEGADGRNIPLTVVREDLETGEEIGEPYERTPQSSYNIYSPGTASVVAEEIKTKFFYNPANITSMYSYRNGIDAFPKTSFDNLRYLTLYSDNLEFMPDLKTYARRVERVNMQFQNFFNSANHANENNLNGDGSFFDGSIQANMDRLPSSVKYFDFRNSFEGDATDLDLTHLPVLETPLLGAYNTNSRYPQLRLGDDGATFASATLRINFNPQTALNAGTGVFTFTEHGLKSGDYVRYDVRVGDDDGDATTIEGTLGTAIGGLVDETIYKVASVTENTFTLQTIQNQVISSYSSTGTGTFHSFVVWDISANDGAGDIKYNTQVGLVSWPQSNNYTLRYIPTSVADSKRMTSFSVRTCPSLVGTSEYRFYDDSTTDTIAKSNEDREHYLATDKLKTYVSSNTQLTFLDYSKWDNTLTSLTLYDTDPLDTFPLVSRTLDSSKLTPLPNLLKLEIKSCGTTSRRIFGNVSAVFRNKPDMSTVIFGQNKGLQFSLNDNTFSGSPRISKLELYESTYSNLDDYLALSPYGIEHDLFGLEGASGSDKTGQILQTVKNRINTFYFSSHRYTATKFIHADRSLGVEDMNGTSWRPVYITYSQIFGTFPNIGGIASGRQATISNMRTMTVPMFAMKPGEAYKFSAMDFSTTQRNSIFAESGGGSFEYDLCKEEMIDMGWKQGSFVGVGNKDNDIVPWGSNTLHGSHPSSNDWFIYQPLTANSLIAGITYVILDPDGTSEAQWQALGVSGTPAKGTKFTATTSANRINMADIQSGVEYKIIQTGNSTSAWSTVKSGGSTAVDTVFTANSNGVEAERTHGGYVQKVSTTNYGTGTVARYSMKSVATPGTSWELQTGTGGEIVGLSGLQYLFMYNNNFYGDFPKLRQGGSGKTLQYLFVYGNRFTGPLPDLSGITGITNIYAYDNKFDSHTPGTLSDATLISYASFRNNALRAEDTLSIINDLWENRSKSKSTGVYFQFTGQDAGIDSQGQPIKRMCLQALKDDPGAEADLSPYNKWRSLTTDHGWTISLDEDYL